MSDAPPRAGEWDSGRSLFRRVSLTRRSSGEWIFWVSDPHQKFDAVKNGKEMSYDCKVDPPFVGYAKPWMDLDTGNSYCLFFPYSPEHLERSIPRMKDMRPYISVSINASLKEANHVSGSASALFIGGFSILEMDKSLMQLNLTPDSNKTIITSWVIQDFIKISPIHKEDFGLGGRADYEVKVLKAKRFKDKIIIALPANSQRVEIDVNYEPDAGDASKTIFKSSIFNGSWVFSCGTGNDIYFQKFHSDVQQNSPYPTPATPSITAPLTPERSSPILNEQSPRTPQPFVDYVRRTIDETPYYKQESRRFDPQRTY
ncbi:hypothetical protein GH714_009804 [Hevea brasiliensis]|uniref:Uncharacterized protein n=1 Tax=Hevea brasiliensis TaxID=3981 RepID=A0A6A6M7T1_HEVBR|nr:hypothetical protein GH714_009804 [Hevea brasiliensis]